MRWNSCNILYAAPDAKRLWSFDVKSGSFVLEREQRVSHTETLPAKGIAKNWSSLWSPKLNVAWLPLESVFLRVIELPVRNLEETQAMVELQLEKLSPIPVAQILWTLHVIGTHHSPPKPDGTVEHLQTIIVVIAERSVVEEFLGKLESAGYLADQLEVPMFDQLAMLEAAGDGVWLFPFSLGGQNAALGAWWAGGLLRNLSFVTLPVAGDRAKELKDQLAHLAWAGEIEGWLTASPKWHLVADPANATEWENVLGAALNEPVQIVAPPAPVELAARTAQRAAAAGKSNLLPAEFTARYHQQFVDRLWLRGLAYAGLAYAVFLVLYFCAVGVQGFRTRSVEAQVAAIHGSYMNALQLKARYEVLKERQLLKYAALDCWRLVAQELSPELSLSRSSFTDGHKMSLGGQVAAADTQKIIDFYDALRKAKLNGQPLFDARPASGDQLVYRQAGDKVTWNFALELKHVEAETP